MYDQAFFNTIRDGCQRSADVVVPLVLERVAPQTVLDVGCGEGWWGKRFEDAGCSVTGLDMNIGEPAITIRDVDLAEPGSITERADLVVCLEVAEHLPESRGPSLVRELCAAAPAVLFSAAIPGQSGSGHVNCQPASYWAALFGEHLFGVSDELRWLIWDDPRAEVWYRQNLLLASRDSVSSRPLDVVHPGIYEWTL